MKNTVIASIVAILCTVAICVTYATCTPSSKKKDASVVEESGYITEEEAAEYIGVSTEIMQIMREKLNYLKGSYMEYTYVDDAGKEVTLYVYSKDALNDVMKTMMNNAARSKIDFKYLQDKEKTEKTK